MKLVYVDTSVLLATALGEPGCERVRKTLRRFDGLVTSGLTEAEFAARLRREQVVGKAIPGQVAFVSHPPRLSAEVERVLDAGYARGADTWHIAVALFVDPTAKSLKFATLDAKQADVARAVGFAVLA